MRGVPTWMWDTWRSGKFVGNSRPNSRVTISKTVLRKDGSNFRSLLFDASEQAVELPNIKSVAIDRRLQTDSAACTIVMTNQTAVNVNDNLDLAHDGSSSFPTRRDLGDLGKPGYYTFRRGLAVGADGVTNPWNHEVDTTWVDMLIPNRLIKVYQGYGTDGAGEPGNDTRLMLAGTFLIDSVEFKATDSTIVITCRDLAKLLIEQRLYPPIIPLEHYPLELEADHTETIFETFYYDALPTTFVDGEATPVSSYHGGPSEYTHGWDSSVAAIYGYDAAIYGYTASMAFDEDWSSYWLSVGYSSPNASYSFPWIAAQNAGNWINRVQFAPLYGGYTAYLSIKVDGQWIGANTIPASPGPVADEKAAIPYYLVANIPNNEEYYVFELDFSYQVDELRITFTNLANDGRGTYPYRAGVRNLQAYNVSQEPQINRNEGTREVSQFVEGNIDDYTEIVKLFSAWAGFWWPQGTYDTFFDKWGGAGTGRVWGDFFYSGAYPVAPPTIPTDYWDNKSVMEGINQIKEILGFIFYVDAYGGVIWRPPNIWKTGNYVLGTGYVGADSVVEIDETEVLIDYGVTIDDRNLRSDIIVVSADDPSVHGSYSPGFATGETVPTTIDTSDKALLGGQERIMLVPNYPFGDADNPRAQAEVEKFAYLVSLWIHWSYRKSRFRIPGILAFEPDDQVRITERVTSETYIHYIEGVNSTMDLQRGTWYMDLTTHWLGQGPDSTWIVNAQDMNPALFAYLKTNDLLSDEVLADPNSWPPGWEIYEEPPVITEPERTDTDLVATFPPPPSIAIAPADFDFESDYGSGYETEPTYNPDGTLSNPGTVYAGSNAWAFEFWGKGPNKPKPVPTFSCEEGGHMTTILWLEAFAGSLNGRTHVFQNDNVYLRVDSRSLKAWYALRDIIVSQQFVVRAQDTGALACRGIYLGNNQYSTETWSNHAWGIATDINWDTYPYGSTTSDSKMLNLAQAAQALRTGNSKQVFKWGGTWSTPDPMHFQIIATPSDISSGSIV